MPRTKRGPFAKKFKTPTLAEDEKVIHCRKCHTSITVTAGLDEMVAHWETYHPELVDQMRAGHKPDPQFHD